MDTENNRRDELGGYRLCGPLGSAPGGSSYVAGRARADGRWQTCALKLRVLPAHGPQRRAEWIGRNRPTLELRHAHLASVLEVAEGAEHGFVVMEYLAGEDLAAVLFQQGRAGLPVEIALTVVQQCLAALHHAQSIRAGNGPGGLVHGAIRPNNVVITYEGLAKLTDFGAPAGALGPADVYLAPEQTVGAPADHQSDLHAVGVLLWEALAGRRMPGRDTGTPPLRSLRPDISSDLELAVQRALERDRQRRFGSALEMARALEEVARRRTRPTPEGVGLWLRGLFGGERARLRRAIELGHGGPDGVALATARLTELVRDTVRRSGALPVVAGPGAAPPVPARTRPLWVNSRTPVELLAVDHVAQGEAQGEAREEAHHHAQDEAQEAEAAQEEAQAALQGGRTGATDDPLAPRTADGPSLADFSVEPVTTAAPLPRMKTASWLTSAATLVAVVAVAAGLFSARHRGPAARTADDPTRATGALRVESTPPGAHLLVDGDPSGLTTPAVIDGLPSGRMLEIQLHKPGFRPLVRRLEVVAGTSRLFAFTLEETSGTVHLDGLPAGARVFVDDLPAEGEGPLLLSLGKRRLRVETADDVVWTGELEVKRGEQRLSVGARGASR